MSVLFHCINGLGLGHLSRQVSIAKNLRKLVPKIKIFFMISAEEHFWLREENFPYYYVPSEAHYRFTWDVNDEDINEDIRRISSPTGLNNAIFWNLLKFLKPSAVVFDTYFSFEKIDAVFAGSGIPIAFYDGCDSRLDFHQENMKRILHFGGHILFGRDKKKILPFDDHGRVHHVGRIIRKVDWKRAREIKKKRADKELRIICTQGGGGFNSYSSIFYKKHPEFVLVTLEALKAVYQKVISFECLFILGPYGRWPENLILPEWVKTVTFEPEFLEHLAASDMMISTGGYNSVSDSIVSHCPAIFLPIEEFSENQTDHVRELCDQEAALKAPHNADYVEKTLLELMINKDHRLAMSAKLKQISKTIDGAERSARIIKDIAI